uniref:RNase H type-1 domain-containing protein n=1 Tax=Cannabis sativa TaxID=3483 RepID=A0A803QFK7_CANSA
MMPFGRVKIRVLLVLSSRPDPLCNSGVQLVWRSMGRCWCLVLIRIRLCGKKLLLNTIKVNVDGAIFAEEHKYGFGCVACGANGRLIEAISSSQLGIVGPEIAEVIGVKETLSWIKRKGWMEVEIETDALVVVQAVMGSIQMPSQFGFLVQDCRNLLSCINHVSLHFVKRSANRATYCVARASCYHSDRIFCEQDAPLELMSIVDVECL